MRDAYYRSQCEIPREYDVVIDLIKALNPYARGKTPEETEEFATNAVNSCIRAVLFGDIGPWCATGMCVALRVTNDPKREGYRKVRLAVSP